MSIEKVLADNEDMRQCIRIFDETLLTKANKSGLFAFEESVNENFVKHYDWREIKNRLEKNDLERNDKVKEI